MADVKIRLALSSQEDAAFILAAFDSALPFLASIGSEAQWGSVPWVARARRLSTTADAASTAASAPSPT
jgi:hypothetical protein